MTLNESVKNKYVSVSMIFGEWNHKFNPMWLHELSWVYRLKNHLNAHEVCYRAFFFQKKKKGEKEKEKKKEKKLLLHELEE